MKTFFEFQSELFQPTPAELKEDSEEFINPGMFARQLSDFLVGKLSEHGWQLGDVVVEDWGHFIPVQNLEAQMAVCCGQQYEGSHLVFTDPKKPVFRKWFRKTDITDQLLRLRDDIERILAAEPEITDLVSEEPR